MRELYVDKKLLDYSLIEALQLGRTLRENADYHEDFSRAGAERMLEKAKEFFKKGKDILSVLD